MKIPPAGVELDSVTANADNGLRKQADSSGAISVHSEPKLVATEADGLVTIGPACGLNDPRLLDIVNRWTGLSEATRERIHELATADGTQSAQGSRLTDTQGNRGKGRQKRSQAVVEDSTN